MARSGLRVKTQVPGTPSDGSLSESSLSDPPTPPVPSCAHHGPASLTYPHSRRAPPSPHSRISFPVPQQIRDPSNPRFATTDPFFLNPNGLTKAQRARLFEIELEKSEH